MDSSNMTTWRVREAVAEDVPDILQMIKVISFNVLTKIAEQQIILFQKRMELGRVYFTGYIPHTGHCFIDW